MIDSLLVISSTSAILRHKEQQRRNEFRWNVHANRLQNGNGKMCLPLSITTKSNSRGRRLQAGGSMRSLNTVSASILRCLCASLKVSAKVPQCCAATCGYGLGCSSVALRPLPSTKVELKSFHRKRIHRRWQEDTCSCHGLVLFGRRRGCTSSFYVCTVLAQWAVPCILPFERISK